MRRVLFVALVAALVFAPAAGAWTWPVDGPVVQHFVFDRAHPYAAGEHRGIDIAAAAGARVLAPGSGTVTFAGTVPTSGITLTIATRDGLAVSLTHLGALSVARGDAVVEGGVVGTVGPSGEAEQAQPYLHLGIRTVADAQGYLDPETILPARAAAQPPPTAGAGQPQTAPSIPAAASPVEPEPQPAPPAPAAAPAPVDAPAPESAVGAPIPIASPGLVVTAAAAPALVVARRAHTTGAPPAPAPVRAAAASAGLGSRRPVRAPHAAARVSRPRAPVPSRTASRPYAGARDPLAAERPAPRLVAGAVAPAPRTALLPFGLLAALAAGLIAALAAAAVAGKRARMIARDAAERTEDPGCAGVAVRGWLPPPRARSGLRAVRRVREVSPAAGQRRARRERDRRARHAGDGGGGS